MFEYRTKSLLKNLSTSLPSDKCLSERERGEDGAQSGGGMRGYRRSTAAEVVLWWGENEEVAVGEDETGWKCWKHPSQPRYGVCPACLRDRLLRLCPDCANVRPCRCFPSSSSSSSSSSFSSLSSTELARSSGQGGDGAGIGAVGPVSRLIESEPAFRRSRSVGFQFLSSRSAASSVSDVAPLPRPGGGKRSALLRAFWRVPAGEEPADGKLCRSRSVAAGRSQDAGGGEDGERGKGWRWHFPSPIKAFRHRKSTTKVVQERSPLWRG